MPNAKKAITINIGRLFPNQSNIFGLKKGIKLNILFSTFLGAVAKNPARKAAKAAIEAKHIVEKVLKYSHVAFQNSRLA